MIKSAQTAQRRDRVGSPGAYRDDTISHLFIATPKSRADLPEGTTLITSGTTKVRQQG